MAQRNYKSQKPRIGVQGRFIQYNGKLKLEVCLDCIVGKYGKAGSQDSQVLASPIIAYRSWDIKHNQLVSWHEREFVWLPGKTTATCSRNHEIPGRRCGCGLYALERPLERIDRTNMYGKVYGQVKLWGRFRGSDQGESHTRAQYGRPTALLCHNWEQADEIHKVADLYRIPVTHSLKMLMGTDWSTVSDLEGGVLDAHRQGDPGGLRDGGHAGRGPGAPGAGDGAGHGAGIAACRVAAALAADLFELKRLGREGMISFSNIQEIFSFDDDIYPFQDG
jgi:hypothetical protein